VVVWKEWRLDGKKKEGEMIREQERVMQVFYFLERRKKVRWLGSWKGFCKCAILKGFLFLLFADVWSGKRM